MGLRFGPRLFMVLPQGVKLAVKLLLFSAWVQLQGDTPPEDGQAPTGYWAMHPLLRSAVALLNRPC
jgi:hypothetical protein